MPNTTCALGARLAAKRGPTVVRGLNIGGIPQKVFPAGRSPAADGPVVSWPDRPPYLPHRLSLSISKLLLAARTVQDNRSQTPFRIDLPALLGTRRRSGRVVDCDGLENR